MTGSARRMWRDAERVWSPVRPLLVAAAAGTMAGGLVAEVAQARLSPVKSDGAPWSRRLEPMRWWSPVRDVAALCEQPQKQPQLQPEEEVELVPGMTFHDNYKGTMRLVGAGMRRMTPLKIKVYAVGLYVEESILSKRLSKWKGKSAEDFYDDATFWETMCSPDVAKTIVMIIARDVTGKHIQQGFDRAMLRRVRQLQKAGKPGGKQALKKMNMAIAAQGTMRLGKEIHFEFRGSGVLHVGLPDGSSVQVENEALCLSLAEMFMGKQAASPEAKREFASGFERLLGT